MEKKGDIKHKRSNSWIALASAILLFVPMAGVTQTDANPAVQAVADRVSQIHYRARHQAIENMGLGIYGGTQYDMGYRNRDGWEDPGSLGNQEARLYIQNAFTAMGLSVSVQGNYLNVVGELTGTTSHSCALSGT